MDQETKRNAYLYCMFRDQQFSFYEAYARKHGMSIKELLVCNVLYYSINGLTQNEIVKKTLISKQMVNVIIKNLMKNNYVDIQEVENNKKTKLIIMNERGRNYCGDIVRHITSCEDLAMSMLSKDQQELLIELSRTFTNNLKKLVESEEE